MCGCRPAPPQISPLWSQPVLRGSPTIDQVSAPRFTAGSDGMTTADAPSLTGFTVAITASRRVDEFTAMLHRRGADVVAAAAIHMVPLADDARLTAPPPKKRENHHAPPPHPT